MLLDHYWSRPFTPRHDLPRKGPALIHIKHWWHNENLEDWSSQAATAVSLVCHFPDREWVSISEAKFTQKARMADLFWLEIGVVAVSVCWRFWGLYVHLWGTWKLERAVGRSLPSCVKVRYGSHQWNHSSPVDCAREPDLHDLVWSDAEVVWGYRAWTWVLEWAVKP